ncbi:MAG: Gfo/Idh/MocA family oxidoreductase [Hyphomicrobiaceae bacterium]|nr:Gfo/Idh/MocA family oxidoreductase [Hyphomicrobiaceae bacterium]
MTWLQIVVLSISFKGRFRIVINAAIVGLGRWGQRLVSSVQGEGVPASTLLRFTRGVAPRPAKSEDFARAHGLAVATEYAEVLADPGIAAVVLATPHTQHAEQAIAAAKAGKAVFVDKPFTLTRASAEAVVAACGKAGVTLAVGQNRRFLPSAIELKRMIDSGELGTVLHAEGNFSSGSGLRYPAGGWRTRREEAPGGGMTALGIHALDMLINLCGPVTEVDARSQRRVMQADVDDTTAMLLAFRSGAIGTLASVLASASCFRIQVFGSKGWGELRGFDTLVVAGPDGAPVERKMPPPDIERAELEAFAATMAGTGTFPVAAEEAINAVSVLEAIPQSAARRAPVAIA